MFTEHAYSSRRAEALLERLQGVLEARQPDGGVAAALRVIERQSSGCARDLWGFAAANAELAQAATCERSARWLWATAHDYARRAADV